MCLSICSSLAPPDPPPDLQSNAQPQEGPAEGLMPGPARGPTLALPGLKLYLKPGWRCLFWAFYLVLLEVLNFILCLLYTSDAADE